MYARGRVDVYLVGRSQSGHGPDGSASVAEHDSRAPRTKGVLSRSIKNQPTVSEFFRPSKQHDAVGHGLREIYLCCT